MRRTIIASTAAAVVLCLAPLSATQAASSPPTPGAAGIGDPYFPQDGNGGYDVGHYAISIGYSPTSRALTGHTVVSAVAKQSLSRFDLDLEGLTVDSLRVNGQPATWSRTTHELRITPKKALQKGSTFTVDARYHGKPLLLDETALGNGGWFNTPDGAVVVGQPHVAATWFPVNDHPLDKATYAIDITVPKGLEALSNGRLAGFRPRRVRKSTWKWRMDKPMASYLATATTGQFDLTSYQRDGLSFIDGGLHGTVPAPTGCARARAFAISGFPGLGLPEAPAHHLGAGVRWQAHLPRAARHRADVGLLLRGGPPGRYGEVDHAARPQRAHLDRRRQQLPAGGMDGPAPVPHALPDRGERRHLLADGHHRRVERGVG